MSKIEPNFSELRSAKRKGFIPFVTAGDPRLETSKEIVLTLVRNGADIIELGVPFSDPMADGPTIQASSQRALAQGISLTVILQMVRELRNETDVPIVLFSYLNPLFRYGFERLASDAADVGIDGILVTDAVDEEAEVISSTLKNHGIDLISLIAPTTTDERLADIAARQGNRVAADTLLRRALAIVDTLHPTLHEAAYLAWGFAALGDKNRAIRLLERYQPRGEAHYQLHLQRDPLLDPLRSLPAFRALLVRKEQIRGR